MAYRMMIFLVLILGIAASPLVSAADAPAANTKREAPVGKGDAAPEFTLEDQAGRMVTLSTEWKKQPVVLIFYRGHW